MTCRQFTAFIADFLAGELPTLAREQFQHHLGLCANCARYLADYRAAIALGQQAFADLDAPVPDDVPQELVDAILRARRASSDS